MLLGSLGVCVLIAAVLLPLLCVFLLRRTVEEPERLRAKQLQK
jgi:hypothetical protein